MTDEANDQAELRALLIDSLGFDQFLELQMNLQVMNALNTLERTFQVLSMQPSNVNQTQETSTRKRDKSSDTAPAA